MGALRIEPREVESVGYRVLEVHGELGLADVEQLEAALSEAVADRDGVIVGLEGCPFLDSMALAALVGARRRFAEDGKTVVIGGPTAQVRRVLEFSGLDTRGFVFDSVEHALGESPGPSDHP